MEFNSKWSAGFDATGTYAGTESAILDSDFVSRALRPEARDDDRRKSLGPAIGIKNGVIVSAAFWALAFSLYQLLRLLVT